MERKLYLKLCRQCSVLSEGVLSIKKDVPENLIVMHDGIRYYPQAYVLEFDRQGNVVHRAILHSLNTNTVISTALNQVYQTKEQL